MNVVLMPSAYLPSLGGVEELTRHLALGLISKGESVEIWAPGATGSRPGETEQTDGLRVRRFPYTLPRASARSWLPFIAQCGTTLRAMREAAAQFQPDLLHVQCFGPNGAYATAYSHLTGLPLVVTLQGETVMDDANIFSVSTSLRWSLRQGLSRARAVTACSRFTLLDAEARFGLTPGKGTVIYNGVDLSGATTGDETGGRDTGTDVLALGRVVTNKGFDLLVRAFARVAGSHPNSRLLIGGSGAATAPLQQLIDDLSLSHRVLLLGRLSREEVAEAMERAALFVVPSRLEPFGIVVLEAWRAGLPVIASSIGGIPEFVEDGQTGLLVDPHDSSALAAALDRMLSDAALRERMGTAGREAVSNFDWSVICDRYREVYTGVTAEHAA